MTTEKQRKYGKWYRQHNKKKLAAYAKKWRARNKKKWKKIHTKSMETRRELSKEEGRRYRRKNRKKINTRIRDYTRWRSQEYRAEILDTFGNKCQRCGFSDKRALHIDHKNGGGNKDRKRFKSPLNYYKHVLKVGSKKFQLLCSNCNWIKRAERNEVRT